MVTPALPFHVWDSVLESVKLYFRLNSTWNCFKILKTFTWLVPKINFKISQRSHILWTTKPSSSRTSDQTLNMNLSEGRATAGTWLTSAARDTGPDTATPTWAAPKPVPTEPSSPQHSSWRGGPPRGKASTRKHFTACPVSFKILPQSHCKGDF